MIGPGLTWTIRPSTSKSWSFLRIVSALSCSPSRVRLTSEAGGGFSRPTGGSWNDSAPLLPKSNVSCQARPCSASLPRGRDGSPTTGGAISAGGAAPARGAPAPGEQAGGQRGEQRKPSADVPARGGEPGGAGPAEDPAARGRRICCG